MNGSVSAAWAFGVFRDRAQYQNAQMRMQPQCFASFYESIYSKVSKTRNLFQEEWSFVNSLIPLHWRCFHPRSLPAQSAEAPGWAEVKSFYKTMPGKWRTFHISFSTRDPESFSFWQMKFRIGLKLCLLGGAPDDFPHGSAPLGDECKPRPAEDRLSCVLAKSLQALARDASQGGSRATEG